MLSYLVDPANAITTSELGKLEQSKIRGAMVAKGASTVGVQFDD
ncbi:hypothetical protein [Rhizobium gallicum]|nr:hypothetical protein [Rhizobium gallicum]